MEEGVGGGASLYGEDRGVDAEGGVGVGGVWVAVEVV